MDDAAFPQPLAVEAWSALAATQHLVMLVIDDRCSLLAANAGGAAFLGRAEGVSSSSMDWLDAEDRDTLLGCIASSEPPVEPLLLRRRAGSGAWVQALLVVVIPLAPTPGPRRALLVGRDAAWDATREARVRRAARYEIVGQIASGVAHDLNNVLSTVTTFSDLLLSGAAPGSQTAEDLSEIKRAGIEAAAVIRKLDLFGGGRAHDPGPADVGPLVRGVEKLLRRFFPKQVRVRSEIDPRCPFVAVPPIRLEEVLLALAANAKDVMPEGGTFSIRAYPATAFASGPEPEPTVVLEVSDDGPHNPHPMDRPVFEPFFSTKAPGTGTGLGLSTVASIVAACGGRIHLSANTPTGTLVRIELPAEDPSCGPEVPAALAIERMTAARPDVRSPSALTRP